MKKRITYITLIFLVLIGKANGQMRLWYGHSVNVRVSKPWTISAGQIYMFSEGEFATLQNSLRARYRIKKDLRVGFGYQMSVNPGNLSDQSRKRLSARVEFNTRLENYMIKSTFRTEWHYPERSKFEYRLRYAFKITRRNWDLPMRLRPYITNEFHYYLGGRPFNYRDNEGNKVVTQSPRGLHAHRISFGASFRPLKRTSVSLRFMRQTEFNAGNKYRRINITDPRNGKVKRRFTHFSALILSASYSFKAYNKRRKR